MEDIVTLTQSARVKIRQFFEGSTLRHYSQQEVISGYREKQTHGYYVKKGFIKVVSYTNSGAERVNFIYGPNDFFSFSVFLNKQLPPVFFVALGTVDLYMKSMEDIRTFFLMNPEVMLAAIDQQAATYGRIYNYNLDTAEQKVAFRILAFAERFGEKLDDMYKIDMPLTQQILADTIHLSRERTGRVLNTFEDKGYIIFGRRNVLVRPDQLRTVLDGYM